ncbi:MAG: transcriptional regulator [Ruminiclostridium sp.]|nr:transcriptional regulator [Ruminiclostridium sp.]
MAEVKKKSDKFRNSIIFGMFLVLLSMPACGRPVKNNTVEKGLSVMRPPYDINAVVSRNDTIWAGGRDGVYSFDSRDKKLIGMLKSEFPIKYVKTLCVDNENNLWIGYEGGIAVFDGTSVKNLNEVLRLDDKRVNYIMQDRSGRILVGTWSGVLIFDGKKRTSLTMEDGLINNMVNVIAQDARGGIWFGSYAVPSGGISILNGDKWQYFNAGNGLPNNNITAIETDGSGGLWAGTGFFDKGAACKFEFVNGKWDISKIITKKDGLAGEKVRSIFTAGDGSVWFGSEYDGLAILKNNQFKIVTTKTGLSDNEIKDILQDSKGRIWMGTRSGITVFEP